MISLTKLGLAATAFAALSSVSPDKVDTIVSPLSSNTFCIARGYDYTVATGVEGDSYYSSIYIGSSGIVGFGLGSRDPLSWENAGQTSVLYFDVTQPANSWDTWVDSPYNSGELDFAVF